MRTKGEESNVETISLDEMSTLDVPDAALRSSLDKIASALQKVGAAGTDAQRRRGRAAHQPAGGRRQSVKSARSLAKFDEINRLSAPPPRKRMPRKQPLQRRKRAAPPAKAAAGPAAGPRPKRTGR